jgi:iron complex outermembrane receptor protein
LELSAILPYGFSFDGALGVTNAKFKDYQDEVVGADFSGNKNQLAPDYNLSLALQYLSPKGIEVNLFGKPNELKFFGRAEWTNTGPFYWDIDNSIREESYGLLNLSMGLKSESLDVVVWANNVLDKRYSAVAFSLGGDSPMVQPGNPRTFGMTVRARF